MAGYTIKDNALRKTFDEWVRKASKVRLNPLTEPGVIADSLGPLLEQHFERHAAPILRLSEGALNWLMIEGGFPDLSGISTETPIDFAPVPGRDWWPAAQFTIGAMRAIKLRPASFRSENAGALFQNLVANKTEAKSRDQLRGHTDAAAFPFQREEIEGAKISSSPDFVILVGIRNPKKVQTSLASVDKIFKRIGLEATQYLADAVFQIALQRSFDESFLPSGFLLKDRELLGKDADRNMAFRFRNKGIKSTNSHAQQAKDSLTKVLEGDLATSGGADNVFEKVAVKPGDILFVNNRLALHGREKVTDASSPEVGGKSRWLLRTYGYKGNTRGYCHSSSEFRMLP